MKSIKVLVFILLISFSLIFAGENYMYYLNNFENNYYCFNVEVKPEMEKEFIKDISSSLEGSDIGIFTVDSKQESLFESRIDIYADSIAKKEIANAQISSGDYTSIFSGQAAVGVHDFPQVKDMSARTLYFVGSDIEKMREIVLNLDYDSTLPKPSQGIDSSRTQILEVWAAVILVILFFSVYDMLKRKKEFLLKRLLGERNDIILKNILIDSVVFAGIYFAIKEITGLFTNTFFNDTISNLAVLILILMNALSYTILLKADMRKVFANASISGSVLSFSYVLKVAVIVILFFAISSNLITIRQGINVYSQQDDFEKLKGYSFVNLTSQSEDFETWDNGTALLNEEFYKSNVRAHHGIGMWGIDFNGYNILGMLADYSNDSIIANSESKGYLSKVFDDSLFDEKIPTAFIPEKFKNDREYMGNLSEYLDSTASEYELEDMNLVYHSNNSPITVIDSADDQMPTYSLDVSEVPVIYYPDDNIATSGNDQWYTYGRGVAYSFSDNELEKLTSEYDGNARIEITDAYEFYQEKWSYAEKEMYIALILTILCILLEVIVVKNILTIEYEKNSKEFLLKKLLGYSRFQRYRKTYLTADISSIIAFIITFILFAVISNSQLGYMMIIGIAVMLIENLLITYYAVKMENVSIQKVLKGGGL